jgi:peptidoglycan/LPS O-acetylase OafA/YrhL
MTLTRKYFDTFDALRFFAFLKVFLLHLPLVNFPVFNFLQQGGGMGVSFFFVLSGFLITYMLIMEKSTTGRIQLRQFFWRRILRIWPLYYAMVAFAFLTPWLLQLFGLSSSSTGYTPNWLLSLSFLENYQMIITNDHPNVSPLGVTWSLCIEEHFYLVWGLAFYLLPVKRIPIFFLACMVIAVISRFLFLRNGLPTIDLLTNIDFFVYGSIPAYILVRKGDGLLKWVKAIPFMLQTLIIILVVTYVILSPHFGYSFQSWLGPLVSGILFSLVIILVLPTGSWFRIGKNNLLSRLGRYTYGLYLIHTIVINFLVQIFTRQGLTLEQTGIALAFGFLAFFLSLGAAVISFHFFERPFLRLKDRFRADEKIPGAGVTGFSGSVK